MSMFGGCTCPLCQKMAPMTTKLTQTEKTNLELALNTRPELYKLFAGPHGEALLRAYLIKHGD